MNTDDPNRVGDALAIPISQLGFRYPILFPLLVEALLINLLGLPSPHNRIAVMSSFHYIL